MGGKEINIPLARGLMRCLPFEPNTVCDNHWQRNTPALLVSQGGENALTVITGRALILVHSHSPNARKQGHAHLRPDVADARQPLQSAFASVKVGFASQVVRCFSCFVLYYFLIFPWEFSAWLWRVCVPPRLVCPSLFSVLESEVTITGFPSREKTLINIYNL